MAATTRLTVVALALVVLTGTAVIAGPAFAQELTDDGMSGNDTINDRNETMDDGSMTPTESMDGEDMGNESVDGDEMDTEPMDGDAMATADEMGTDEAMTEDGMAGETDTGGQPGFGIAVVVIALIAAAALALRRRGG